MKYKIKDEEYFIYLFENDNILEELEDMFLDETTFYYYSPDINLEDVINYEEVWEQIETWKGEIHENYEEIKEEDKDYLKKVVVEYIIVDQFFKYETNNLANILETTKMVIKPETHNLLRLYLTFGVKVLIENKNSLRAVLTEACRLNNKKNIFVQVIYNIEEINTEYKYLISPVLTTKINQREIEVPRVLTENKII